MFSRIFIDRPVMASVLAIVMVLAGTIASIVLPVEQYPEIAPPTVQVSTVYPGASAATVAETVAAPIEQEVNGVEDMLYMSSTSSDSGRYVLTVTFRIGADLDLASVRVQNRVAVAEAKLPEEVRRNGITTTKQSTSLLMVISIFSPDGARDQLFLSNYATISIRDVLARVPGVGAVQVFGAKDYSMRIWLDPDRLAARGLTTGDVVSALREQNVQVAAGRLGQAPIDDPAGFQLSINALGRLSTVEQFENIIIKIGEDQRTLRLRDVARVELGAQDYDSESTLNGAPSPAFGIYQLPGTNALDVASGVRAALEDLRPEFPEGVDAKVTYDFTTFVTASIQGVVNTLIIAAILVFLTVWFFLQDFRATLIPGAAIPVSIVGTLAVLYALGFSLNMLTLFGLVLAIGIVVDDAIVVVENTSRLIEQEGLEPKDAARQSMEEITGPVIATTLVLLAVFVPTATLPGMTGELYRQFGVTLSIATVLSSVNALTLSPALCGVLLRKEKKRPWAPFRLINRVIDAATTVYVGLTKVALRVSVLALLVIGGLGAASVWGFLNLPSGFIPDEDQRLVFVNVQLPDAAKLARTNALVNDIEKTVVDTPGVTDVVSIRGNSIISGVLQPNAATLIATLDPWEDRTSRELQIETIMGRIGRSIGGRPEAIMFPFRPPAIQGLGIAGGFDLRVQDRSDAGPIVLQQATDDLIGAATADPRIANLFSGFRAQSPQLFIDIDRTKVKRLGLPLTTVFETLQTNLGSTYVNDLNLFGRTYQVRAQADASFRDEIDDLRRLEMRNRDGGLIPMSAVAEVRNTVGPPAVFRYNLYPSASVTGQPAAGASSGEAVQVMEQLSEQQLPAGFGVEWTGMTYQQQETAGLAPFVFALAVVFAYLFLAAQYESWITPVAILATAPVGVAGALGATWAFGLDINVYTQIGLVLLVALVCKNAILIVEFAEERRKSGESVREATIEASRLRFRPILMTALSFVLGTAPLVIATGAGANSRQAIGVAVFGGMVLATAFGVLLIPMSYHVIREFVALFRRNSRPAG